MVEIAKPHDELPARHARIRMPNHRERQQADRQMAASNRSDRGAQFGTRNRISADRMLSRRRQKLTHVPETPLARRMEILDRPNAYMIRHAAHQSGPRWTDMQPIHAKMNCTIRHVLKERCEKYRW